MKTLQFSSKAICLLLGVILILSSCSSSKKTAISCPELPGYRNAHKVALHHNRHNQHPYAFSVKERKHQGSFASHSKSPARERTRYPKVNNEPGSQAGSSVSSLPGNFSELKKDEFKNNLLASADNSIIQAPMTVSENNPTSPGQNDASEGTISEKSPSAENVKLAPAITSGEKYNAAKKSGMETERIGSVQEMPVKIQPLAIAGLIAGIVGLFVAGIPLGIIAVVFGFIALNKIKRNPNLFRGKGLAIASVILGFVAIIGAIIILSMV